MIALGMALTGCGTKEWGVRVVAKGNINPNENELTAPVAIFVYQLSSKKNFLDIPYEKLAMGEKFDGYIYRDSWVIWPNQKREYKCNLLEESKYIGIVVGYHELEAKKWKAVKKIGFAKRSIKIEVGPLGIKE